MEDLLERYNPWWNIEYRFPIYHQRSHLLEQLERNLENKSIIILTGLRRIGKTTLMKILIEKLIKEHHVDPTHIFYISLDEYQLRDKTLAELLDMYRKIHLLSFDTPLYVFLDEATAMEKVEIQLKNIYDTSPIKIFLSSSSASLIKSKKPYLTGRSTILEVLPLTFDEYLFFKNIVIAPKDAHLYDAYFENFLFEGGVPEFIVRGESVYLKELVDDIIYKDIVSVYRVQDIHVLKDMFLLLMERAGKVCSINKIAKILGIAPDTAKRYLEMFESTYLIHSISRAGKTNERILSAKKLYAPDLGIKSYFSGQRDKGSLFENYVYLLLKAKEPRYVYEDGHEINFITNEKELIECKYGSTMTRAQEKLFENFPAVKRTLISSPKETALFLESN